MSRTDVSIREAYSICLRIVFPPNLIARAFSGQRLHIVHKEYNHGKEQKAEEGKDFAGFAFHDHVLLAKNAEFLRVWAWWIRIGLTVEEGVLALHAQGDAVDDADLGPQQA